MNNIGLISHAASGVAYFVLTLLLLVSWRGQAQGRMIVLASGCSLLWSLVLVLNVAYQTLPSQILLLAELLRNLSWSLFLFSAISSNRRFHQFPLFWAVVSLSCVLIGLVVLSFGLQYEAANGSVAQLLHGLSVQLNIDNSVLNKWLFFVWLAMALLVLVTVEHIFRNSSASQLWASKFLCFGVGSLFAYDFFMYADALMFKRISQNLWDARGFVNFIAMPMLAIAIARTPKFDLNIHVSRTVVFHTTTLMAAGIYLLVMAGAGYIIRFYGGNWGAILEVVFFSGAIAMLVVLLFSDKIRAKTKVFLSKHFYSYKHDYREEWMKFTQNLAESADTIPDRVIRAIVKLTDSQGGMLWEKSDKNGFVLLARWEMPEPVGMVPGSLDSLAGFLETKQWVVDFDEYIADPELYGELELPQWLLNVPHAWLIVPLIFRDACLGFVLVKRSELQKSINWEDRDLLKMAGQQTASHLAQYQADQALLQSQQFEAFNRLSAYVVHDLKNILAQQSLIVANADKHKHKPAFVDDVIATVKNSVGRMTRLMEQMRSGVRGDNPETIQLPEVFEKVMSRASGREPVPVLDNVPDVTVWADREQLLTVFGHIVQNAQDATDRSGSIDIGFTLDGDFCVITIEDTGIGMGDDFIRDRLFKAFDSTKGLAGMGVGAYESREYIRRLGGDILVKSELGIGSIFQITLPLHLSGTDVVNEGVAQ